MDTTAFRPQCKGRWRHPRNVTPEILRWAGEKARQRNSPVTALMSSKITARPSPKGRRSAIIWPVMGRFATAAEPNCLTATTPFVTTTAKPSITAGRQFRALCSSANIDQAGPPSCALKQN